MDSENNAASEPTDAGSEQPEGLATPEGGQSEAAPEGIPAAPAVDSTGMYDPETWSGKQVHEHWQPMYTKRSQELAETRKVADQWSQVQQNPWPVINDFLQRAGYKAVSAAEQAAVSDEFDGGQSAQPNPQAIEQQINAAVEQRVGPMQRSFQERETNNVIAELSREFPDWQQYESEITTNLQQFPNLAFDIQKLYDMSVPGSVRDARAYQRHLKQMENRGALAKTEPATQTIKPQVGEPNHAGDFGASWRYAMEKHGMKSNLP
jgi:hypothetical protein